MCICLVAPVRIGNSIFKSHFLLLKAKSSDPICTISFTGLPWDTFPREEFHPVSCSSPFISNSKTREESKRWKFLVPADWPAGQLSLPTLKLNCPLHLTKPWCTSVLTQKTFSALPATSKQRSRKITYKLLRMGSLLFYDIHPKGKQKWLLYNTVNWETNLGLKIQVW